MEVSLVGETGKLNFSMQEWQMFERYVEFRQRFPLEILATEMQLISEKFGEAGTLDRYIILNGKRLVLDIKTSNNLYDHYWLQLAAYRRMFADISGEQVDGVCILWLNAKTKSDGTKGAIQGKGWQLVIREDSTHDIELYEATKALWKHQNKDATPNNVTYQLTQTLPNRNIGH